MRFHVKQPDIVEQLRFMEKVAIGPFGATAGNAADELERLRTALLDCINGRRDWIERAKAALKDTKP